MEKTDYAKLELLVLDCDGVLTDGRVTLDADGRELKTFHCRDGAGMKYWQRVGKKIAIITGRGSPVVTIRAAELGVEEVHLDVKNKLPVFEQVLAKFGVSSEQVVVIGDDLTDLPMLLNCGFAVTVPEAPEEVKSRAAYVTTLGGGAGCVRETIELILKGSGEWDKIMARYLPSN